jgi:hypothetical protein
VLSEDVARANGVVPVKRSLPIETLVATTPSGVVMSRNTEPSNGDQSPGNRWSAMAVERYSRLGMP